MPRLPARGRPAAAFAAAAFAVAAVAALAGGTAPAAASARTGLWYVALGDSYTAGPFIPRGIVAVRAQAPGGVGAAGRVGVLAGPMHPNALGERAMARDVIAAVRRAAGHHRRVAAGLPGLTAASS